jgi:hypothetical protein
MAGRNGSPGPGAPSVVVCSPVGVGQARLPVPARRGVGGTVARSGPRPAGRNRPKAAGHRGGGWTGGRPGGGAGTDGSSRKTVLECKRGLGEGALPFNPSGNWHREPALAKSTSLAHTDSPRVVATDALEGLAMAFWGVDMRTTVLVSSYSMRASMAMRCRWPIRSSRQCPDGIFERGATRRERRVSIEHASRRASRSPAGGQLIRRCLCRPPLGITLLALD